METIITIIAFVILCSFAYYKFWKIDPYIIYVSKSYQTKELQEYFRINSKFMDYNERAYILKVINRRTKYGQDTKRDNG